MNNKLKSASVPPGIRRLISTHPPVGISLLRKISPALYPYKGGLSPMAFPKYPIHVKPEKLPMNLPHPSIYLNDQRVKIELR